MKKLLLVVLTLVLAACGKPTGSEGAPAQADQPGAPYLGRWVQRTNPDSELEIVTRSGGSFSITWVRHLDRKNTSRQIKKAFDADLVGGKLVSQGFTTFLRDDGVLIFAQDEYQRQK